MRVQSSSALSSKTRPAFFGKMAKKVPSASLRVPPPGS